MAVVNVVKYNGGPEVLAWKYPNDELGTWTQLIVNESQEAVLFKEGQATDIFQGGRYTLDTMNIPVLNKLLNLPFGGSSPFKAEVWYINRAYLLDAKWGTASPIQIQDPKYQIFCPVRSNGTFGIQIEDSRMFLLKLVGTMTVFDRKTMIRYFRGLFITKIKDAISSYVVKKKISVLELNAYIDELSLYMKERIEPEMSEYGVRLVNFYINDISIPEEDPAVLKLKDALSKKAEMNIIGYSYQQKRSFDTLDNAVTNEGKGSALNSGIELGMGLKIGKTMGATLENINESFSVNSPDARKCPQCHSQLPETQRFCGQCGYDTEKNVSDTFIKTDINKILCSGCGSELNSDAKFCIECGKRYNPCPDCRNDLPEDSVLCSSCGYEIPKQCPECGKQLPRKTKFCSECGFGFLKKCSKCSTVIYDNQNFCLECGEKI